MMDIVITIILVIAAYAAYPYLQNMIYRRR
jgi:hypothetical protein